MKKLLKLSEIKATVNRLAAKIEAPHNTLPTYGHSEQTGRPHIEVDSRGYHYMVSERGHEFERHTTGDIDECLYMIFADVTFELSIRYELAHRVENEDHRRKMFQHQVELLSMLSPDWGERMLHEHEKILKEYPYDDSASLRAILCNNLREQGHSAEQAEKIALEKYPVPKST